MAETVEAQSYNRNVLGSIPDRNNKIFSSWNFHFFRSAWTKKITVFFLSFGSLRVTLNYQRHLLIVAAKFGKEKEDYPISPKESQENCVEISTCVQCASFGFS